jgi:8-oxo-dGTP diphosphatase
MISASIFVDTQTKNRACSSTPYLACCALIIQNNRIFVSQRQSFQSYPGLWEYPGGKIEPHETLFESLVREIKEEVDLNIHTARPIMSLSIPNQRWVSVWRVESFTGEAWGKEQQMAQWVTLNMLDTLPFLPSNQPVLDHIRQTKALI